jgi:serpin B
MLRSLLIVCLLSPWISPILVVRAVGESSPLGDASHALGLKMLRDEAHLAENLCVSPFGLVHALSLASVGAGGDTRTEILKALELPPEEPRLLEAVREVSGALRRIDGTNTVSLTVANRLFLNAGIRTRPEFVRAVASGFGEMPGFLDLDHDPEASRRMINGWAREVSHAAIGELIPSGGLGREDALLLINAVHLRVQWNAPFPHAGTSPAPFFLTPTQPVEVSTMREVEILPVAHCPGYTTIVLPCHEQSVRAVLWLPDAGVSVTELAARLSAEGLQNPDGLERRRVALHLPKFRLESLKLDAKAAVKTCGIRLAWDPARADFSRVAIPGQQKPLHLGSIVQRTKMEVTEIGFEGSSISEILVRLTRTFPTEEPTEIRVNRPFLMAMQHVPTGTCLVLARVMDPR